MEKDDDIDQRAFRLGGVLVEPTRNILKKDDEIYSLEPLIMDVLCLLAKNSREVVTRDRLISQIWGVEHGADESLTRAISLLRKTFRAAGEPDGYIETIPKRGYRLKQPLSEASPKDLRAKTSVIENTPPPKTSAVPEKRLPEVQHVQDKPRGSSFEKPSRGGEVKPKKGMWRNYRWALWLIGLAAMIGLIAAALYKPSQPIKLGDSASAGKGRSVAVLSFADMTAQRDLEYFSDGMAEEILSGLAKIPDLRVAPRASAFAYKGRNVDMREIGRKLDVSHIIDGSVRTQGNIVRITAQLIDTASGQTMWANAYDGDLKDILRLQQDISTEISNELKLMLSIGVEEIIALDVGVASEEKTQDAESNIISKDTGAPGRRPRSIGEDLWSGSTKGRKEGNPEDVLRLAKSSKSGQFIDMATLLEQGEILTAMGQYTEALNLYETARQRDPLSTLTLTHLSAYYRQTSDYPKAMRMARRNIRWNPDSPNGRLDLAALLIADGDLSGAHMVLLDGAQSSPDNADIQRSLFALYARLGLAEQAKIYTQSETQKIIVQILSGDLRAAKKRQRRYKAPSEISLAAYILGDIDMAYIGFRQLIDGYHLTTHAASPEGVDALAMAVHIAGIKNDPDAGALAVQLESYFDARSLETLRLAQDLKASMMLAALNQNKSTLLRRLDHAAGQGFSEPSFLRLPIFEVYTDDLEWIMSAEKIENNAIGHRKMIQSQLEARRED